MLSLSPLVDLTSRFVSNITLYFLLFVPLTLYALYNAYATPLRHVPGPFWAKFSRLWILGAVVSRKWDRIILDLHKKYGPIVRVAPHELSIDDPEIANIIYRAKESLPKSARYSAWGLPPPAEPNLFTTRDIDLANKRRREIAPLYAAPAIASIEYQIDRTTTIFMQKLRSFAQTSSKFDLAKWLQFYTFDTIGTITFDRTFGFIEQGVDVGNIMAPIHSYARYGAVVGNYPALHKPIFNLLQWLAPAGEVGLAYVMGFSDRCVKEWNEKRSETEKRSNEEQTLGGASLKSDFMSSLLAKTRRDPTFLPQDVTFHILSNVAAGGETTGITMAAAMYHLLLNPPILRKLRSALCASGIHPNGQDVPLKTTQSCEYLQAVIKETLRIFPAAGLNMPRVVPEGGMVLGGYMVPAGTDVGVNPYVAHQNTSVYGSDAAEFRPERWLQDPDQEDVEQWEARVIRMESYFMTFGKGPRNCLGRWTALVEIAKCLPRLVGEWEWDVCFDGASHANSEGGSVRGKAGERGGDWTVYNDWFVQQEGFFVKVREREGEEPAEMNGELEG